MYVVTMFIRLMGCIDWRRYFDDEDRYAVAVVKDGTVAAHIPRKISRIYSLLLAKGGIITCMRIGGRIYSSHLQLNIFAIIFSIKYFKCFMYLNFV